MKKSLAREFWSDVKDALYEHFDGDDSFWSTETYMDNDPYDGTEGACIDIEVDYEAVPEEYDDIFGEIENAVSNCGWDYRADWNGNVYEVAIWED